MEIYVRSWLTGCCEHCQLPTIVKNIKLNLVVVVMLKGNNLICLVLLNFIWITTISDSFTHYLVQGSRSNSRSFTCKLRTAGLSNLKMWVTQLKMKFF